MRLATCGAAAINHECGLIRQIRKRMDMPLKDYQPLPLPKEGPGRVLSDDERQRLLRVAQSNPNWEAAYLFAVIAVNTTAGPKEVATLRLTDVDLERRTIRIQPHGAKNVFRVRTIPLNDECLRAVTRAVARAKELGSSQPEHYIFPFRMNHSKTFDPNRYQTSFKTAWKKLREDAKLHGLRIYDLRHHAITVLLENPDVSEETVEDIAGHVSRRMKKRYSHIRIEVKRQAVEAMLRKQFRIKVEPEQVADDLQEQVGRKLLTLLGGLVKATRQRSRAELPEAKPLLLVPPKLKD